MDAETEAEARDERILTNGNGIQEDLHKAHAGRRGTFTRKGEQFARWRDAKGKTRTEKLTKTPRPPAEPPASPRVNPKSYFLSVIRPWGRAQRP